MIPGMNTSGQVRLAQELPQEAMRGSQSPPKLNEGRARAPGLVAIDQFEVKSGVKGAEHLVVTPKRGRRIFSN